MHPHRNETITAATMANLIGTMMHLIIHSSRAVFLPEERPDTALEVYPARRMGEAGGAIVR